MNISHINVNCEDLTLQFFLFYKCSFLFSPSAKQCVCVCACMHACVRERDTELFKSCICFLHYLPSTTGLNKSSAWLYSQALGSWHHRYVCVCAGLCGESSICESSTQVSWNRPLRAETWEKERTRRPSSCLLLRCLPSAYETGKLQVLPQLNRSLCIPLERKKKLGALNNQQKCFQLPNTRLRPECFCIMYMHLDVVLLLYFFFYFLFYFAGKNSNQVSKGRQWHNW